MTGKKMKSRLLFGSERDVRGHDVRRIEDQWSLDSVNDLVRRWTVVDV
jgi:hypothetical protein